MLGEAEKALINARVKLKIRTYSAIICTAARLGEFAAAERALKMLVDAPLTPTEVEYSTLLVAYARCERWDDAAATLLSMKQVIDFVSDSTVDAIESYFTLQNKSALGMKWQSQRCTVDKRGNCQGCGRLLDSFTLSDDEFHDFRSGVEKLAEGRSTDSAQPSFRAFKAWMQKHAPWDVVVDGANVGMNQQNYPGGCFRMEAVKNTIAHFEAQNKKVLVILHTRRIESELSAADQKLSTELQANGTLYVTPRGANDDWYWIYAAVCSGPDARFVSNDMLRDHIFQLTRPK